MNVAGKKLLFVVPSATSFLTFLAAGAEEWRRLGGAVAVAAGPDLAGHEAALVGPGAWSRGVEQLSLPAFRLGSPLATLRAARRLRGRIREWRPDIVHAHFAAAVFLAALVRPWVGDSRSAGRPAAWLGTFHGLHRSSPRTGPGAALLRDRLHDTIEVWSARRMTEVAVLNAEDRDVLQAASGGVPVHLHRSCGVGCDLDRFDAALFPAADRAEARRRVGLSTTAFVLAFIGRRTAFKGFDTVVRAYRLLRESGIDVALLLVGASDPAHRSGLTAAEHHDLEHDPHVVSLGWRWDVAAALAMADCCLLPSVREGMPVSLMEALAMGVPAITVAARGCRDVVRDGVDGFVLPAATAEDVARSAATLAADARLRESMQAAAIAGRRRFDRRIFTAEQLALQTRLVGRGRADVECPPRSPT